MVERIVIETMMCMNHFDNWNKQPKAACKYLNSNAIEEEFEVLASHLHRLEHIITDDIKDIFNKKDSFIFLTLFDKFTKLGMEDIEFAEFLREFKRNLRVTKTNAAGLLFDEIKQNNSTKDKSVIADKLAMLESLMLEFLHTDKISSCHNGVEEFIAENLDMDVEEIREDMDLYNESLDILLENTVRLGSKLRNEENRPSLLAMMTYSYKKDVDLDEWLADYAKKNNTYFADQKKNFIRMRNDFVRSIAAK